VGVTKKRMVTPVKPNAMELLSIQKDHAVNKATWKVFMCLSAYVVENAKIHHS
jgi:hypothetical protein